MKRSEVRKNAMISLYQTLLRKESLSSIIINNDVFLNLKDDPLYIDLTFKVMDAKQSLISIINKNLYNWKFERLGFLEQAILLMGVQEILIAKTKKAIIIDEAVKLAKEYADIDSYKLINGVLEHV